MNPSAFQSQTKLDYLDASLTVEVKSFKAKVNILRIRYLRGNPDRWNASYISGEIIKTYNNMLEDGTWKHEIGEKDQIIALTTKLTEMQAKFEQQVAAFATQQQSGGNKEKTENSKSEDSSRRGKKEPYTVASWRLVKKEDKVTVNGNYTVAKNTMECMQITSLVITTPGAKQLTNVMPRAIPVESQPLTLQRILNLLLLQRKSLLSMTSFETLFALKLDSLPKGRCSGKRVGPNHGWSSSRILALFCFLLLLPIRITLLLPNLSCLSSRSLSLAYHSLVMFSNILSKTFPSNYLAGYDTSLSHTSRLYYTVSLDSIVQYSWSHRIFGSYYGIPMVDQFILCFATPLAMDILSQE